MIGRCACWLRKAAWHVGYGPSFCASTGVALASLSDSQSAGACSLCMHRCPAFESAGEPMEIGDEPIESWGRAYQKWWPAYRNCGRAYRKFGRAYRKGVGAVRYGSAVAICRHDGAGACPSMFLQLRCRCSSLQRSAALAPESLCQNVGLAPFLIPLLEVLAGPHHRMLARS